MSSFLNPQISCDFRQSINKSQVFVQDNKYKDYYNLSCAVMDRVDTCVSYLNKHEDYPNSEEEFLSFMMFGTMLVDAIKQINKNLNIQNIYINKEDEYRFFSELYYNESLNISKEEYPTDDKFFEYFRALTFAHPYETNRAKFLKKGEIQYSPWVIVNKSISALYGMEDAVGVRIYSNKYDDIIDLRISFQTLKDYIKSRYEQMNYATEWFKEKLELEKEIWKNQKINQNQLPIEVLKEIESILNSRYIESYEIKIAIEYLECKLTEKRNEYVVSIYRRAVTDLIPKICYMIESLNEQESSEMLADIVFTRPKNMHQMGHYQLEKIFSYLHYGEGPNNVEWGLKNANDFSKEFAKKWVSIDTNQMNFEEIKLLVRTACFLEREEQKKKVVSY